jgi:hypothetical protein
MTAAAINQYYRDFLGNSFSPKVAVAFWQLFFTGISVTGNCHFIFLAHVVMEYLLIILLP